jgi:iron-sulfur cluster repair protein YtfE (RIC family)
VTGTREALEAALSAPEDTELAARATELMRDLAAFVAEDLVVHIAKEEDVLFPALRGFAGDLDKVVDEMVEQHDEIRFRKELVQQAVAHMDDAHDEVREAAAEVSEAAGAGTLAAMHDAVKRLDWILQGHFGDEEDDLFPPALQLLSPETFVRLAREAAALDRRL